MLFLTPQERNQQRRDEDRPELGLRITFPNKCVHFIPGSTYETAWALVVFSPAYQWIEHPQTVIEYGERHRGRFTPQKLIKAATQENGK
jgi:hypothetical protein